MRLALKRLTERAAPQLVVLSYSEIAPGLRVESIGQITATEETAEAKSETKPAASTSQSDTGVVNLTSDPVGADISLDGNFIGNSPATLKLAAGTHTILVKMAGYADWTRQITVGAGSEVQLTATLEKAQ